MPNIDPIEALLDAVVAHLADELGAGVNVRKGWPEQNMSLDLATKPGIAVHVLGEPNIETCAPHQIGRTAGDPPTWLYRIGWVNATLQIDLWCGYKATREETAPDVAAALRNGMPHHADLWLEAANYFDRPITAVIAVELLDDDADTAPAGEWRKTWRLDAVMDQVVEYEGPELTEFVARLTTQPDGITEPDVVVPEP